MSTIGTPLEPRNLHRRFKAFPKSAGLPESTRFHDLRHATATLLLAQGCSLRVIQEVLGHSSISTTADVYSHVATELVREAAEKMAAALGAENG